jgi:hypothetical protein
MVITKGTLEMNHGKRYLSKKSMFDAKVFNSNLDADIIIFVPLVNEKGIKL